MFSKLDDIRLRHDSSLDTWGAVVTPRLSKERRAASYRQPERLLERAGAVCPVAARIDCKDGYE